MDRREFLALAALPVLPRRELDRHVITSVSGFRHVCERPKFVGKNAYRGDHGRQTVDDVLRIKTDTGIEGIGVGAPSRQQAEALIGKSLGDLLTPSAIGASPLARHDHALYDLVGKALGVPAWKLLGGQGADKVRVYDGSIYFVDLIPEYEKSYIDRILVEVDMGLAAGLRAFKIKVGRGFKWMPREAGDRRDIEVVRAIKEHVGPEVRLMVDGNNGFDAEGAIRWLDALDVELYFVEEMFPETVAGDLKLKGHIASRGWKTKVADGESAGKVEHFDPYLKAAAIDVLQGDIRAFGLSELHEQSRRALACPGATLAPHNWGSFLGVYMQATLARGIPNFEMAEMDRAASDLFDVSLYPLKDGLMGVPDVPGVGLSIRQDVYAAKYKAKAWAVGKA